MASARNIEYASKTQHYLKVKKPLLERQRRARINKCLDALKELVAEFQGDDAILRMDKAEMLESTIAFMRTPAAKNAMTSTNTNAAVPMDSFRNGYMNAVSEVSRVMASTPGMSVNVGKSVMIHLGCEYNRLLQCSTQLKCKEMQPVYVDTATSTAPMSPASSGYHSDYTESPMASPVNLAASNPSTVWRPW